MPSFHLQIGAILPLIAQPVINNNIPTGVTDRICGRVLNADQTAANQVITGTSVCSECREEFKSCWIFGKGGTVEVIASGISGFSPNSKSETFTKPNFATLGIQTYCTIQYKFILKTIDPLSRADYKKFDLQDSAEPLPHEVGQPI